MTSILVADDSPRIRGLVKTILRRPGVRIREAFDGVDAIDQSAKSRPDLVIMDFSMPRMNGLEAGRILHDRMSEVPLILFTVHAELIPPEEMQASGFSAVVCKSDVSALIAFVNTFLPAKPPNPPRRGPPSH